MFWNTEAFNCLVYDPSAVTVQPLPNFLSAAKVDLNT